MKISIHESFPDVNAYWQLFQTTGWNERYQLTQAALLEAIKNSWYLVTCYTNEKLIGSGRIISDGIHHAFIVDMIVHPDFQGKGAGKIILEKLLKKCFQHQIKDIQLFAAKDKFQFYEKFNFIRRPENAPGMQYEYKNDVMPF